MVIWIVEDSDDDVRKASEVVTRVAGERTGNAVKLYRVKLIEWPPELRVLGESENRIETNIQKARPSIVILDIFDDGGFRAPQFLRGLREWEHDQESTVVQGFRSFVILWTVKTGEDHVLSFLQQQTQRDRRISYTQTKNPVLLRDHLEGFWRQCDEEKNP